MQRILLILAAIYTFLFLPALSSAQSFDLWVGGGRLEGDTTYTIGGHVSDNLGNVGDLWWPLSELKWPLDVWMLSAGARVDFSRFSVSGEVFKSVTNDAGDMEDSDWGVYFLGTGNPFFQTDTKDVFSTSEADLDALIFDVRARYWALKRGPFSLAVGAGWRYEDFDFEAGNVNQYSPSAPTYGLSSDPFAFSDPGLVITYDVTYTIPYIEIAADITAGEKVTLEAFVGYSPIVNAEDKDDHLLRSLLSEGDCDGTAIMVGIDARYDITKHWFGLLGFDYISIDTDGTQTQSSYAGELTGLVSKIDQEITSSQTYFYIEAGYSF